MVTISMRVPIRCPACAADAEASCAGCGGIAPSEELFSAWLAVRPGVADGTVLTPSALLPGMVRPVSFRVRLRTHRPIRSPEVATDPGDAGSAAPANESAN